MTNVERIRKIENLNYSCLTMDAVELFKNITDDENLDDSEVRLLTKFLKEAVTIYAQLFEDNKLFFISEDEIRVQKKVYRDILARADEHDKVLEERDILFDQKEEATLERDDLSLRLYASEEELEDKAYHLEQIRIRLSNTQDNLNRICKDYAVLEAKYDMSKELNDKIIDVLLHVVKKGNDV